MELNDNNVVAILMTSAIEPKTKNPTIFLDFISNIDSPSYFIKKLSGIDFIIQK